MSDVVILGAGVGETLIVHEVPPQMLKADRVTLIRQDKHYQFVPSNLWVAVGWRDRTDSEVDLSGIMQRKGIRHLTQGARRVDPDARHIELNGGGTVVYGYLGIATGPGLAFDDIEGLGPDAFTQSICHIDRTTQAHAVFEARCRNPGPIMVGLVQGTICFGPANDFAFVLDIERRKRRVRDRVKMTFVTPDPYIGDLGLDGVGDTKSLMDSEFRNRHIGWVTNARVQRVTQNAGSVEAVDDNGIPRKTRELPDHFVMRRLDIEKLKAVE